MNMGKYMKCLFGKISMLKPNCALCILTLMICLSSCTEEFDLQLEGEQKLVINCEITNLEPPYYVHIYKSKSSFGDYWQVSNDNNYGLEPVQDATVIISDDNEAIDTLALAPDSIQYWSEYEERFMVRKASNSGGKGYYVTSKIVGVPEHTYSLLVEWNGHKYSAECKMPKAVEIDSIGGFRETSKEVDKVEYGYVPLLWFTDDTTVDNYYVFSEPMIGGSVWINTILSDANMDSNVAGIDALVGESPKSYERGAVIGTRVSKDWGYDMVIMYSVTKEVYDFYNSAIQQIRYDGGVYTPAPATPPTNIKGGALGLFNVASADYLFFR